MQLTSEERTKVDNWNALGEKLTDNTMHNFIPTWFANARALLQAHFPLHSANELATRLGSESDSFIVLGSGPSIQRICRKLPLKHSPVLCGPTALGVLLREGIRPRAIIVADASHDQYLHVVESLIPSLEFIDVVLPVIADPAWYGCDSPFRRDNLYFFLPYMDYLGSTDIAFNHILHALFPDVATWIGQAGSVAALVLNIADMACGEVTDKRIYIGADFSWTKGLPRRAPMRFDDTSCYSESLRKWHEANFDKLPDNVIDVESADGTLQTDLLSVSYATQFFYIIHSWITNRTFSPDRFVLLYDASKLYRAIAKDVKFPSVKRTTDATSPADDAWAYKIVLALINLFTITQEESPNGESKETPPALGT